MNAAELLDQLKSQGVCLTVVGGQLRYRAPKGIMDSEKRELITKNKTELVSILAREDTPTDAIQPWNPELIERSLRGGRFVRIWSRVLNRWVVWVRDESVKAEAERRYPGTLIFTLPELTALIEAKCTPEQLRAIAETRSVFGNSCSLKVDKTDPTGGDVS